MKVKIFLISFFIVVVSCMEAQIITTIAGTGTYGYNGDGIPATSAQLGDPSGIAIDAAGNIYVAEQYNNRIRKINTAGIITTIAGTGTIGYSGDGGPATAAQLKSPTGLAFDKFGNLYIADQYNYCVRKVNTAGIVSTVAGTGIQGYSGDGGPATAAELNNTAGVIFDKQGNLYIGDNTNHRVRKVNTSGVISTFAGTGILGNNGDGGQASSAELNVPAFFAIDTMSGNFFISDEVNNNIRKITGLGIISTISNGSGIFEPEMIALDPGGNLYAADYGNNRVIRIDPFGNYTTIAGTGTAGYTGDGGFATAAELNEPMGLAFDAGGNLYICDWNNSVIRKVSHVAQPAGINRLATNNLQINIYPNPTKGKLYISNFSVNQTSAYIEVTDVTGKLIAKQQSQITAGIIELNLDANSGVYFVKVVNPLSGNTQVQKVIINK